MRGKKTRMTAACDADLTLVPLLGHGYQARMNAVLRTYILDPGASFLTHAISSS